MNSNGFQYLVDQDPKTLLASSLTVNYDFADVLGLKVKEGRFFSREFNEERNIVINETAVRETGMQNPIGNYLYFNNPDSSRRPGSTLLAL